MRRHYIKIIYFNLQKFLVFIDFLCAQYYNYCTDNKSEVISISPRTGRPHLPDSERKDIRLYLRLNESENKMLEKLAEKLQLNKTQTILKAIALLAENTK